MSYSLNSVIINPSSKSSQKMQLYFVMDMVVMVMIYLYLQIIGKTFYQIHYLYVPMLQKFVKLIPSGYQWFDLMDQTDEETLSKSLIAENKLE